MCTIHNRYRRREACTVHVFDGHTENGHYTSLRGQCMVKQAVGGWKCYNVLSEQADCIQVFFYFHTLYDLLVNFIFYDRRNQMNLTMSEYAPEPY